MKIISVCASWNGKSVVTYWRRQKWMRNEWSDRERYSPYPSVIASTIFIWPGFSLKYFYFGLNICVFILENFDKSIDKKGKRKRYDFFALLLRTETKIDNDGEVRKQSVDGNCYDCYTREKNVLKTYRKDSLKNSITCQKTNHFLLWVWRSDLDYRMHKTIAQE